MEPKIETKKPKKVNYVKVLDEKRAELAEKLRELNPGSEEYEITRKAIEDISRILNERSNTGANILKIGGVLLLTVFGLGLAHWDDIGDSIPGKFVSKFTDGIMNRLSR